MASSFTDITSLISMVNESVYINIQTPLEEKDEESLLVIFFDGNETIKNRIRSFQELYKKNKDICYDSVNKISSMFSFSPTVIFKNLLTELALNETIDINIRIECGRTLYDKDKEIGYKCLDSISENMKDFPIPLQIDIIRTLIETEKYYDKTLSKFISILTNKKLECEYRYKTILSIQKDSSRNYISRYIDDVYIAFFKNEATITRYKILSAQYLLQKYKNIKENTIVDDVENICISFARDNSLDYNLRADSADLLVRLGTQKSKEIGKDIITLLGRSNNMMSTVYNNKQNVHDGDIDESIKKFILYLASIRSELNTEGNHKTFSDAKNEIEEKVEGEKKDLVRNSLLRISLDQTIYDGCQTLQSIFNKIWGLISLHEYKEILKTRMIEELIDMANTCSSGHISRLVNVLCGFEIDGKTFSIDIGWKKQIRSNLLARISKLIKDYPDEKKREIILEEMSTSGDMINKPELSSFFRSNLLPIRDELYKEFVGGKYISDDDFEEFFRSAIIFFEEGE